jgi:hypothetical protein
MAQFQQKVFCCQRFDDLKEGMEGPAWPIWYNWDYDGKVYLKSHDRSSGDITEKYEIFYCPFCGKKVEYEPK